MIDPFSYDVVIHVCVVDVKAKISALCYCIYRWYRMSMVWIQVENTAVRVSYSWKESMCTTTKQQGGVMFPGLFWLIWYGVHCLDT